MKPFDGPNDMIHSVRDADGLIMEVLQYLFVHILQPLNDAICKVKAASNEPALHCIHFVYNWLYIKSVSLMYPIAFHLESLSKKYIATAPTQRNSRRKVIDKN